MDKKDPRDLCREVEKLIRDDKARPYITEPERRVLDLCREVQKQGWGTVEIIVKDGRITRAKAAREVKMD